MKRKTTCDDCKAMEKLLARVYHAFRKLAWEEVETENEAVDAVKDFIDARYGPLWPKRLKRQKPPTDKGQS